MGRKIKVITFALVSCIVMNSQIFAVKYQPNTNDNINKDNMSTLEENNYVLKDVNSDGKINALDASFILDKFNSGDITEEDIEKADINNDGKVNVQDASIILDVYLAGK